jgi:predicted Zn-dependent protease
MAQQIAHVIARHAAIREEQPGSTGANAYDPQRSSHAATLTRFASFSRAQEIEADTMGVEIVAKAGFDPFGAARLLSAMERNAELRSAGRAQSPDLFPCSDA